MTCISTPLKKALYDNLDKNAELAVQIYNVLLERHTPNWRDIKVRKISLKKAIGSATGLDGDELDKVMSIIIANDEF